MPSFDPMPAGVIVAVGGTSHGQAVPATLVYETIVLAGDGAAMPSPPRAYTPSGDALAAMTAVGPPATSAVRATGRARYAVDGEPSKVAEPRYVVARRDVLQRVDLGRLDGSWSAAEEARIAAGDDRHHVVRATELEPRTALVTG